ncbi:MAG: siroheme synthase CysG [Rubrimonas sp.]|uniref:siroheme synthase CysG n=1 Tax=Rubrimonas sp. TaxID=2036015 RepID=UPI002FDDFDCA
MRHFPLFRDLRGRRVVVSGGGETALAKLRLLLRTEARLAVYASDPAPEILRWAAEGRLLLTPRPVAAGDALCAALFYAANADAAEDARAARIGREAGALVNIVDDLEGSDFITPALVDRDPVTVAIGTEGAAPVLARRIKADVEAMLAPSLGALARIAAELRPEAEALPAGAPRRAFWTRFHEADGPRALAEAGEEGLRRAARLWLAEAVAGAAAPRRGFVALVGAGPGDPELLTLKARKRLHEADVVIHDRLVSAEVLELARREARLIEVGKTPDGPSWRQADIDALIVAEAQAGAQVVRLKSGDPGMFGRLDEELSALEAAGVGFEIVPGITAASAAAAALGQSLTQRGRNSEVRFLTGRDAEGFAEHDWRALARPGAVAAIYMGLRAARFVQGRLMLHGAAPDAPVTAVENASRAEQKIVATTLARLPQALAEAGLRGPAVIFIGLAPRGALAAMDELPALEAAL